MHHKGGTDISYVSKLSSPFVWKKARSWTLEIDLLLIHSSDIYADGDNGDDNDDDGGNSWDGDNVEDTDEAVIETVVTRVSVV